MSAERGWSVTTASGRSGRPWRSDLAVLRRVLPVLAHREFQVRYRTSALNVAWSILQPLGFALIYAWLFAVVLQVDADGLPYLSFTFAGIVAFRFLSFTASASFPSIHEQQATVSKVAIPPEALPLAVVVGALVDLTVMIAILTVMATFQGLVPSITFLALLPVGAVLVVWAAAVCVLGGVATVFIRDLNLALPVFLQLLFVGSPIFYPPSALPERFAWLNGLNPLAVVIESLRDTVLRGDWPDWSLLGAQAVAGGSALVLALLYARSVGPRVVDLA